MLGLLKMHHCYYCDINGLIGTLFGNGRESFQICGLNPLKVIHEYGRELSSLAGISTTQSTKLVVTFAISPRSA